MRIVYLGTPDFAVKPLETLASKQNVSIVGVICQPTKTGNRNKAAIPPVKLAAENLGLPVYEFAKIRKEGVQLLCDLRPDLLVTCAYGQILSQEILDIAKYGVLNIHASLLPKYRGAAPINWVLINGETQTGVTIMRTVLALDAGDILLSASVDIAEEDNSFTLSQKLSTLGADLICKAVDTVESGKAVYIPQNHTQATFCSKLTAETERVNWSNSALSICNLIRGLSPKPSCYSVIGGKRCKITAATPVDIDLTQYTAEKTGQVIAANKKGITVKCGYGALLLTRVQLEGGKELSAADAVNGRKISLGQVFENE